MLPEKVFFPNRVEYYLNGKLNREDGPAIEWDSGSKSWFINGKHHREDGPAVERATGVKRWYIKNYLHRIDGLAIEEPECQGFNYVYDNFSLEYKNDLMLLSYLRAKYEIF